MSTSDPFSLFLALTGTRVDPQDPAAEVLTLLQQKQQVVLAGYAGTGKTTLVGKLAKAWRGPLLLAAPTGRAALRMKEVLGRPAQTLHSLLFEPPKTDDLGTAVSWEPRKQPIGGPGTLLVVDEASMLNEFLVQSLGRVIAPGTKILFSGDPAQLSPVEGAPGVKLDSPDILLTKVWRTALDSPIMRLVTWMREEWNDPKELWSAVHRFADGDRLIATSYKDIDPAEWQARARKAKLDTALIAWRNDTRQNINARVRAMLGHPNNDVIVGDRLLVLSNHPMGLVNGQTVDITKVTHGAFSCSDTPKTLREVVADGYQFFLRPDLLGVRRELWTKASKKEAEHFAYLYRVQGHFMADRWKQDMQEWAKTGKRKGALIGPARTLIHVDYGDCLTAHRAQGSEWPLVGITGPDTIGLMNASRRNETSEFRQWWYTAATRARNKLIIWL